MPLRIIHYLCTKKKDVMDITLNEFYAANVDSLSEKISGLKHKSKVLVAAELTTFILSITFVVMFTAIDAVGMWTLYTAAGLLLAYLAIRKLDVSNSDRIERLSDKRSVYEKEMRYHKGDYSVFDDGERYADPKHEYTFDMDIFGKQSLYNRMCRAVTTGGADKLAEELRTSALSACKRAEDISQMNEATKELADMEQWRTSFLALGQQSRIDTSAVTNALDEMKHTTVALAATNTVTFIVAWAAIAGFWSSVALALFTPLSANVPLWWGVCQFTVVYMICSSPLRTITKTIGRLHKQLKAYIGLMRLISQLNPKAANNKAAVATICGSETNAITSFSEMESILDGLDRRGNVLGMILFNALFISDFFLVRKFLLWQQQYMGSIQSWIDTVIEMDARVSMATFRYNEPSATDAEIENSDKLVYEGKGIRHPFLGEKAVSNDFSITDGNYYIVTGANMAGKSTFLRSLGVNYILAMTGLPVFARSLRVSVFSLFSSMRTSDDLTHGISYFNAELLRLKQLIDSCKQSDKTLIILDEILKGTNSLDKLNGSRMFLDAISTLPVSGVIATHDLELSKMADERPDRFHNYCFEIRLSNDITYTYKITPGVARNQNATYLLQNIIKAI